MSVDLTLWASYSSIGATDNAIGCIAAIEKHAKSAMAKHTESAA